MVQDAATRHFQSLLEDTRKSNSDSRSVLMENGVVFVTPTDEAVAELVAGRDKAVKRLRGKAFSQGIYDEAVRILSENRQ